MYNQEETQQARSTAHRKSTPQKAGLKGRVSAFGLPIAPVMFLLTGLLVQVVTYTIAPDNPWSLVSGLFGICSVVLCSQGKIWTFFFGFGQIITYTYLCYLERFYAGIAMNCFYFISQIVGIRQWRRRLDGDMTDADTSVTTRHLSRRFLLRLTAGVLLLSAVVGRLLDVYTDDTQPYLDAITTVPAIAAQILMILCYSEQWYYWLMIDILYVLMWGQAENWCMVAQYVFWCANCVYGMVRWKKLEE